MKCKLFRNYTFGWQQVALFKITLIAIGIAIGAHWNTFFQNTMPIVLLVAVLGAVYSSSVALKQIK